MTKEECWERDLKLHGTGSGHSNYDRALYFAGWDARQSEVDAYKRMAKCRYLHQFTILGTGYCNKCGWHQPSMNVDGEKL